MWYEAMSDIRPKTVESDLSQKYVYIRRNIRESSIEDFDGERTIYVFEETKISKDIYEQLEPQSKRLDDIENAIAEIIGGGL